MGIQMLRYHKSLAVALLAGLLVLGVSVLWLFYTVDRVAVPDHAQTVQDGDLRVTLQLDQPTLGNRVVDITVRDSADKAVVLRGAQLTFSMAEMDMGTIRADTQPIGTGRFQARGPFFTMAGRWAVEVVLQRENGATLRVPFTVAIAAPGEVSGPLNPLTPDGATLAAGGQLYRDYCAVCHGAQGRGDGPAAMALNPRPSDFTQHMIPGLHTDGQIFLWIKDGYPNTAMPAWGQRLNEEQIWQLVTYLRTFGIRAPASGTTVAPKITAQPPTTQPIVPPETREPLPPLIFTRAGNLWRSDGSQAAPRQITDLPVGRFAQYPRVSPDGSRIAFIATTQAPITATTTLPLPIPNTQLYVMRTNGSDLRMIWDPDRGVLGPPSWGPDGKALYLSIADVLSPPDAPVADRLFQIMRVDPQTGGQQRVLKDAYDLTFARDGQQRVFLRWHANFADFTLNVAAPDGSGEHEVMPYGVFSNIVGPRFSPDGRQIIFTCTNGPVTDSQGYPINAREQEPLEQVLGLLAPGAAEAHAALSDLWVVKTDGTGLRRLTHVGMDTPTAVFSPDGRQIVMMGENGIYLMNADGTQLRLIDSNGDHGGLDWGPP